MLTVTYAVTYKPPMLSVIMLNVVILNVVILNVIILNAVMLSRCRGGPLEGRTTQTSPAKACKCKRSSLMQQPSTTNGGKRFYLALKPGCVRRRLRVCRRI
jgi:hypothetical protein